MVCDIYMKLNLSVHKYLLEYLHTHSFTYRLCLLSHNNDTVE